MADVTHIGPRRPGRPRVYGARVQLYVRLPVELHERLTEASAERELSMNLLMIKAIDVYLDSLVPLP